MALAFRALTTTLRLSSLPSLVPSSSLSPTSSRGDELSELASCLDQSTEGHTATWRDSGRSMPIAFEPQDGGVTITLIDEMSSGAELMLPFYLDGAGWAAEQRALVQQVEARFPAESVQISSGVWTWKIR